jgi:hypothetical protein
LKAQNGKQKEKCPCWTKEDLLDANANIDEWDCGQTIAETSKIYLQDKFYPNGFEAQTSDGGGLCRYLTTGDTKISIPSKESQAC